MWGGIPFLIEEQRWKDGLSQAVSLRFVTSQHIIFTLRWRRVSYLWRERTSTSTGSPIMLYHSRDSSHLCQRQI